jgi:formylglycine-generating enzyme required for sulfatase activity
MVSELPDGGPGAFASVMPEETSAPSPERPKRKFARRWSLALGVAVLALAGWWFGVELPERRAAAELKRQQAEKSFRIADLGLDMVWIPPGEFLMGTPGKNFLMRWFYQAREKLTKKPNPGNSSSDDERPVTWVTLTRPFWLGRTEVTQAQWTAVMGSNPSGFKGESLPVESVSWDDAMEFCRKLTERERAANRLPVGHVYTLPTEAQWEYVCRAGATSDYAGDMDAMAWTDDNSGGTTHAVGTKLANAWGVSDMSGNVSEWCLDWYDNYRGGQVSNPRGPLSGTLRVLRGGVWTFPSNHYARVAKRNRDGPGLRVDDLGFRFALAPATVVSSPPATPAEKN